MGLTGLIGLILLLVAFATAVLGELSEKEDGRGKQHERTSTRR